MRLELRWLRQNNKPDVLQYREFDDDDPYTEWENVPFDGPFLTDPE